MKIDYYYQISRATEEKEIDIIEKNLETGFGSLPKETKTLLNAARARVLLTGSLIKKIEASESSLVLFFKKPGENFNVVGFFKSVRNFKHKKMLNYKYKNSQEFGLKITLETFRFFPSMDLLFSFLKLTKKHLNVFT